MANVFAVSVVGCDEPGIIASVSRVLFDLDCNLADTNMSVLNGRFAMILIVQAAEGLTAERVSRELGHVTKRFELVVFVQPLRDAGVPGGRERERSGSVMVSVYGADAPGIVQSVTAAIAATGSNITDLRTQQFNAQNALYALFMDVELAAGASRDTLTAALRPIARQYGVEVNVNAVEGTEL